MLFFCWSCGLLFQLPIQHACKLEVSALLDVFARDTEENINDTLHLLVFQTIALVNAHCFITLAFMAFHRRCLVVGSNGSGEFLACIWMSATSFSMVFHRRCLVVGSNVSGECPRTTQRAPRTLSGRPLR